MFFSIVLPLSKAALATVGIFTAVLLWNIFLHPFLFIRNPKLMPLQLLLRSHFASGAGGETTETLKFDPFGGISYYKISLQEAQLAEERVAAVREAVGPHVDILVEAHARFDAMNAIQLGKRLEPYRPLWYEEPVSEERVEELVDVRRKVNIPIATGERLYTKFPFAEIVERHAADVLQPDIANAGGITELKKIAIIAEAKHITMAPHNVCSPVGAQAELHLDASIINFEIQEYHAEFYSDQYFTVCPGFPRQVDGYVQLSDAPGLGLAFDEAEIPKYPPLKKVHARGGRIKGI